MKKQILNVFFLFFWLSFVLNGQAQSLWANVYPQIAPFTSGTYQVSGLNVVGSSDGGFICTAEDFSTNADSVYLFKVDSLGNFLWRKHLLDFKPAESGFLGQNLVVLNSGKIFVAGRKVSNYVPELRCFDANGNLLWANTANLVNCTYSTLIQSNDGMLAGLVRGYTPHLIKMDTTNGNIIWDLDQQNNAAWGYCLSIVQDNVGNYYLPSAYIGGGGIRQLWKISPSGQLINNMTIGGVNQYIDGIIYTQDGNLLIVSTDIPFSQNGINVELTKVSPTGTPIWVKNIPNLDGQRIYGFQEKSNGDILFCSMYQNNSGLANLTCVNADGVLKWMKPIVYPINPNGYCYRATDVFAVNDNDFVCIGMYTTSSYYPFLVRTDTSAAIYYEHITLAAYPDYNLNCGQDTNENFSINNLLYQLIDNSTGMPYYGYSGGIYNNAFIYLPTGGSYSLTLSPQDTNEWVIGCGIDTLTVITGANNSYNLPLQPKYLCPRNTIDIASPFLQPGYDGDVFVYYCNKGTVKALNTQIVVMLDSFLTYLTAPILPSSVNGQILTFQTGDLEVGECKMLNITCLVDTLTPIGNWHTNVGHIVPDTICGNYWTGAILNLKGYCENDTFQFFISNTGTDMLTTSISKLYANNVLVKTDTFQMLQGQSTTLTIPDTYAANYYRMDVYQVANFPANLGNNIATLNLIPCNGTYTNSMGGLDNNYHGMTSTDVSHSQNGNSFDPNDKTATPAGVDVQHFITNNGKMEYLIRFQNTGTAPAVNVIVLDTLDIGLDLSTLAIVNASHPFVMNILPNRIIQFVFSDIMLPDSNADELHSHGFINYTIHQMPNLPVAIELHNTAGIYFDFNSPVLTNDAWHTIGIPSILSIPSLTTNISDALQLIPNPMNESAEIRWSNRDYQTFYKLSIQDINGRTIREESFEYPFIFYRKNLATGFYLLQIQDTKGNYIGSLRMIVR